MLYQPPLPEDYANLGRAEMLDRIAARKGQLGKGLCILGHHYQSDDVIQFADFVGDSLKLSQQAAAIEDVRYIVFCGVHFMAESADILSQGRASVVLPHQMAGCSMAEMADDDVVALALDELTHASGERVIPVTYVNSTASVKAATARAGGACCTSSNVRNVFAWALAPLDQGGAGGQKVLAIPDRHLGLNTALAMGNSPDQCVLYDPHLHQGGLSLSDIARAKFILWKGQCYVHQQFRPKHVHDVRRAVPGVQVIVHPECPHEVVELADASGSTEQIIQAIAQAQAGTSWAIGTETNLVNRLAKRHGDRYIRTLGDVAALCIQMARIDLSHLLWTLDNLAQGLLVNHVRVQPDVAADARIALERMISIKAATGLTRTTHQ